MFEDLTLSPPPLSATTVGAHLEKRGEHGPPDKQDKELLAREEQAEQRPSDKQDNEPLARVQKR